MIVKLSHEEMWNYNFYFNRRQFQLHDESISFLLGLDSRLFKYDSFNNKRNYINAYCTVKDEKEDNDFLGFLND